MILSWQTVLHSTNKRLDYAPISFSVETGLIWLDPLLSHDEVMIMTIKVASLWQHQISTYWIALPININV